MINPNDEIQQIVDHIENYAAAEANLAWLESYKHALKALKMKESLSPSIAGKEMDALASDDYVEYCHNLEEAKRKHTTLKLTIETCKLKIEVWRTEQATNRQIEKITR
jgi:hypothetical protein